MDNFYKRKKGCVRPTWFLYSKYYIYTLYILYFTFCLKKVFCLITDISAKKVEFFLTPSLRKTQMENILYQGKRRTILKDTGATVHWKFPTIQNKMFVVSCHERFLKMHLIIKTIVQTKKNTKTRYQNILINYLM